MMTLGFNDTKDFLSQLWNCISVQHQPLSPADFEILDSWIYFVAENDIRIVVFFHKKQFLPDHKSEIPQHAYLELLVP